MTASLTTAALALAERGFAVFPCAPRGKVPVVAGGCKAATRDLKQIREWWGEDPERNIGIATGKPSGVYVIDLDVGADKDGRRALAEIEDKHAQALPETLKATTGSGGVHLYYKMPTGPNAPKMLNSAGRVGPGIDIRGDGGYVIAPPSIHANGRRYEWATKGIKPAPCWAWFEIDYIERPAPNVIPFRRKREPARFASDADFDGVSEGSRNDAAARVFGYWLRICEGPHTAYTRLERWNRKNKPPLDDAELVRIAESIYRRHLMSGGGR